MEKINFPLEKNDWKKFEKNSIKIALNDFLYTKKETIYNAYVSKHISNREKQVILLMIPNGERWHYLVMKVINVINRNNI